MKKEEVKGICRVSAAIFQLAPSSSRFCHFDFLKHHVWPDRRLRPRIKAHINLRSSRMQAITMLNRSIHFRAQKTIKDLVSLIAKPNRKASRASSTVYKAIVRSREFDSEFYRNNYPDVASSNQDPIAHYIAYGASELRNPSANFDTGFYLDAHPDVAKSGINPLYHYIVHGKAESRAVAPAGFGSLKEAVYLTTRSIFHPIQILRKLALIRSPTTWPLVMRKGVIQIVSFPRAGMRLLIRTWSHQIPIH
ncbi:hypothetical protein N7E02_19415 [Aliirhizobium terrae]|uniref:hypothetical protein n=1 Tax=Terrirhizobium terrae TaxID=2926709 RepID=UPI002577D502|nr:hypothetical protein [Rhizobium sp. CC-CFT758]WJH39059.1 hypothetical protein N7E02_19415 [Rhizobium sp. CC-CFT758]